jgi:hypothetical protein
MVNNLKFGSKMLLLAGLSASSIVIPGGITQCAQKKDKPAATSTAISSPAASSGTTSASPSSLPARDVRNLGADKMYQLRWGIQDIHVRETASGSLIRFSYRVVNAAKAKVLNDASLTPILTNASTGDKLEIPETENAGKLRQVAPPQNGREYWMVFLNNSRFVKSGTRVNVVIGKFHAEGLMVEPSLSRVAAKKP